MNTDAHRWSTREPPHPQDAVNPRLTPALPVTCKGVLRQGIWVQASLDQPPVSTTGPLLGLGIRTAQS